MSDSLIAVVALGLVPLLVVALTSFVKISVVLSLLRNGFGTPDAPSTWVVTSLAMVLTVVVMAPVGADMLAAVDPPTAPGGSLPTPAPGSPSAPTIAPSARSSGSPTAPNPSAPGTAQGTAAEAPSPLVAGPGGGGTAAAGTRAIAHSTTAPAAEGEGSAEARLGAQLEAALPPAWHGAWRKWRAASGPLRAFLWRNADAADRALFVGVARDLGRPAADDDFSVIAPAFVTSELKEAFMIAIALLIPFLILDVLVGLGLATLGLGGVSPSVVALPLKLILFVSVDGWRLLVEGLLRGYAP